MSPTNRDTKEEEITPVCMAEDKNEEGEPKIKSYSKTNRSSEGARDFTFRPDNTHAMSSHNKKSIIQTEAVTLRFNADGSPKPYN